ncbi:MAG TPA: hydrogen gas-evolving membrane-bound hydrogenase subunit E [Phycisphaerae bacterium]|nr:hydrogen gas-evolving membrane-bound hydrogenase subunit E [Phycisphaerae bacterium]
MDPVLALLLVLLGFMVIASLVAIETRGLLSSVISVGAAGFALSIVFLLLGAPDLAITQVVVEILVLVVLVRVVITRRDETYATSRSTLAVGSVLLVLGILVAVVFWALGASGGAGLQMRPFGNPLLNETGAAATMAPASTAGEADGPVGATAGAEPAPSLSKGVDRPETIPQSIGGAYLQEGLKRTHAANYVMGIVLDYRGYDTLGEATVIFVSIIGAYAVLRRIGRHSHARDEPDR